jgi:ankyrin repeat protein
MFGSEKGVLTMIVLSSRLPLVNPILGFLLCLLAVVAGHALAVDVDALYQAAGDGDASQVSRLLDGGTDVNARTSNSSYALNNAAVENHVEVVRLLLARGADPNVQNGQGDTPLICATKYAGGHAATVKVLVEAGTDLAITDGKGNTALDYAKAKEQRAAIALLESPPN